MFTGLSISRQASETAEELRDPFGLNLLSGPAYPMVDLVFVHGLGGGSRKMWSKGPDLALFWPKEWLSRDIEFKISEFTALGTTLIGAQGKKAYWESTILEKHC